MSAQIIQFGKPQSRKRAAEQPDATASSMPLVERTKLEMQLSANTRRRRKMDEKAAAVRCRVDGKLYEVRFQGGEVLEVLGIHHRTSQDGRIAEIKRRHWAAGSDGERDLDRRVVLAAWRERSRNDAERASRSRWLGRKRHSFWYRNARCRSQDSRRAGWPVSRSRGAANWRHPRDSTQRYSG